MSAFVRELLLGPEALTAGKRSTIAAYLRDVLDQRQFPLHTSVLWNALYFDWDLAEGSYQGRTLNPDRIEERRFGDTDRALPVGAFVRVPAGNDEVWAEVVYKEGRHPEVHENGIVPPHVSGAAGEVENGQVALREMLVCDWNAFGDGFNRQTVLDRLCRRGQLDPDSHLLMTASYRPHQAVLDDATYYIHYLLEHHREGLLAEFVTDDIGGDDLFEMLLNSFRAVEEIASGLDETLRWNRYFLWKPRYQRFVSDTSASAAIGADFFASMLRALTLPGSSRDNVGYAAVGPTIRDHLAANGLTDEERAALYGPGWARLVCYVNTYVAEQVRVDGARITALGDRYHLRRDDAWQSGGIWRTERLDGDANSQWAVYPPLVPLGLGAAGVDRHPTVRPPAPAPEPAPTRTGEREWTAILTANQIDAEALRLPDAVIALLPRGTERVAVRVFEVGRPKPILDERGALDRAAAAVRDIGWTIQFVPGIKLFCSIQRGSDVVRAEIRRVHPPREIDGELVEYEVNEAVFRGGRRRRPLKPDEQRRVSTLAELIGRAFATRGERLPDGGRVLHVGEVGLIVLGPDAKPAAWGPLLNELTTMELERAGDGRLTWRPRVTRRTSLGEASRIASAAAAEPGHHLRTKLRPHVVRMHLRRWTHKDAGTWEERAALYPAEVRRVHAHGRLKPELPPGYTYVSQYEKGSRAASGAEAEAPTIEEGD